MAEPLDARVASDDQARAERTCALEALGHVRLNVDVALARLPRAERSFEGGGSVDGEAGQPLPLRRKQREPQLDQVVVEVNAQAADPLRPRAGERCGHALEP